MQTTTTTTAWPEGVIARYLTVGGATVDVTETRATCAGCGEHATVEWRQDVWDYSTQHYETQIDEGGQLSTPKVRRWSQSHAETCRAMPRPTA